MDIELKFEENEKIARSRFELLSRDPESRMIDRYTTGLKMRIGYISLTSLT